MLFNSYEFVLGFLPAAALGFFLIGRSGGARAALAWLIAASTLFYGWSHPEHLALLIGSILVNFAIGRKLRSRPSRPLLAAGIVLNLLLLGYFKYANFLLDTLTGLTGTDLRIGAILLPLAISFFTLQQVAYLVDAYRGEIEEHGLLRYGLFVALFPQLIAGPIVYFREMYPQLKDRRIVRWEPDNLSIGLTIFSIGLFKKVVIADSLALYVDPVFAYAELGRALTVLEAWAAAVTYGLQIYFDFSGYTDMAIGIARMFGLRLPENFNSPYKARNIIDFWRRWHMTLSRFFRDYLYIPLGGSRAGRTRQFVNLMLTMLIVGLWHGAAWTFVVWGAIHGLYLLIAHAWLQIKERFKWVSGRRSGALGWVAVATTFAAVTVAWVFFRSESFGGATVMLMAMFGQNGLALPRSYEGYLNALGGIGTILSGLGVRFTDLEVFFGGEQLLWLVPLLMLVWLMPNTREIVSEQVGGRAEPVRWLTPQFWPSLRCGVYVGSLTMLALASMTRISEFIYFRF